MWVVGPRTAEIRPERLRAPGPGEVRVRTTWSGISRGTERLVLEGRVPPSLAQSMRAPHQAGDFPWPVKYGYCNVGVVEAGALPAGTRVFCLFPHQDRYVVGADQVVALPDDEPSERAVLADNVETAVNAVWDAQVGPGDRVTVVGAGVVGSLVGWICAGIPGVRVVLVDPLPARAEAARALGCAWSPPEGAPGDQDVVFHASATPAGLATALSLAGPEAMVVELSWYGTTPVPAPLGEAFHHRRLQLRSSQVGSLPPARRPRWDYRRRLGLALALLADPAPDVLVDGEVAFEALPVALPEICGPAGPLCRRVRYPSS
ncbi:MAG: zinc-binding alcohol dehydrogenase [Myxococcota bacterium]